MSSHEIFDTLSDIDNTRCCSYCMLSSWGRQKDPAVTNYECVNLYDGIFVRSLGQVQEQIAFSADSDPMAVDSLINLKREIAVGCGEKDGKRNRLFLSGYFMGQKTQPKTMHNAPEPVKSLFCLRGWFIQIPFFEQIEAPEGEAVPSPKIRNELRGTDFVHLAKPVIIRHKEGSLHYGVGQYDNQ